jgi:hypothetical protein
MRSCTVCPHPKRASIDRELVAGTAVRALARDYGVGRDALMRHKAAHISPALERVAQRREVRQDASLLEKLVDLIERTEQMLEQPERTGNVAQFAMLLRELRALHELMGRASGELKPDGPATVINVLQLPETTRLIQTIREVFADQPARLAVVAERLRLTP